MTYDLWLENVLVSKHLSPEQRLGQHLFNHLRVTQPKLAENVRATGIDPFYRDDLIGAFLEFVSEHWNDR